MAKAKKDPKKQPAKKAAPQKTAKKAAPKAKVAAKPAKGATPKAAAAKAPVKTAKPAKAPKATKETPAKVEAAKKSPKTVEKAAAPAPKKADKKAKKDDLGFDDDFNDNFDDEVAQYEDLKTKTPEQMEELRALLGEADSGDEVEIALRDAEGRLYCRVRDCDELSLVDSYCRYHYLKMWKKIQLRKKILTDGKLEKYIEELTLRYPDKYIEMIREDLRSEKHFLAAIQELEIEDMNEEINEGDDDQGLMDEVRGMQTAGDGDDDTF